MKSNLDKYVLAAGSVLLGSHIAQASIVYTDIIPDVILTDSGNYKLNIMAADRFSINHFIYGAGWNSANIFPSSSNAFVAGNSMSSYDRVSYFGPNSLIGRSNISQWILYQSSLSSSSQWNLASYNSMGYYGGQFINRRGFIGLRFVDAGKTNYGWVQLAVNENSTAVTIYDYAYESTPDKALTTGVVPEPSVLGLLALGAAGLLASRKK